MRRQRWCCKVVIFSAISKHLVWCCADVIIRFDYVPNIPGACCTSLLYTEDVQLNRKQQSAAERRKGMTSSLLCLGCGNEWPHSWIAFKKTTTKKTLEMTKNGFWEIKPRVIVYGIDKWDIMSNVGLKHNGVLYKKNNYKCSLNAATAQQ